MIKRIIFSTLPVVSISLFGCGATLPGYNSGLSYEDVAAKRTPLFERVEGWSLQPACTNLIGHLMYDYRHVYSEENSILVAPLLKYTDYDVRGNHGTMTYRRGKNAVYSYTFYKDINSNLLIEDNSYKENDSTKNPKNAYCAFCTDDGFTDFALKTHTFIAAEIKKNNKNKTCDDFQEFLGNEEKNYTSEFYEISSK